jgi:gas vesicle protein
MKNASKVLIALAAGVAAGSALGMAFAPAKGSETRKKWKEEAKKLKMFQNGDCKKEKLVRVKTKLENVLRKVNSKIESYDQEKTNVA